MAQLIDYPLKQVIDSNTEFMAINTISGGSFETIRVSRNALQNYVNSLIDAAGPTDGKQVELANDGTNIVWRYVGDATWNILVPLADLKGAPGNPGSPGANGAAATITVGTTTTTAAGTNATVSNTGTSQTAILNFTIPRGANGTNGDPGAKGADGADGKSATVAIGTTTTGAVGSNAQVTNSGTASDAVLNFTIPRGAAGTPGAAGNDGAAATISVGTVTTGAAGSQASVTNAGTSAAAVLNFTIPQGAAGAPGSRGNDGAAATITVGGTTTIEAGADAEVTNTGTAQAAELYFSIPKGAKGDPGNPGTAGAKGDDGTPATVSVGTVTTVAPGVQASVTNTGTASAAVFDFNIPRGANGEQGIQGIRGTDGNAATVQVGTVSTGAAGSNATVTNAGTTNAAILNFSIPQGAPGNAADVAAVTHAATSKATPVDADEIPISDSAASWALKKLTWANVKNALSSLFFSKSGGDLNGGINITGTGRRITADFSDATPTNRTMIQSNVSNGITGLWMIPNGTGTISGITMASSSDASNASLGTVTQFATDFRIGAAGSGTGEYTPMTFYTNGIERMRIGTDGAFTMAGNVNISGNARRITGDFSNTTLENRLTFQTTAANALSIVGVIPSGTGTISGFRTHGGIDPANASVLDMVILGGTEGRINCGATGTGTNLPLTIFTSGAERMRILPNGKVGIGVSNIGATLDVAGSVNRILYELDSPNVIQSVVLRDGSVNAPYISRASQYAWQIGTFQSMWINTGGTIFFGKGGAGYGAGTGGSVAQTTSKSTAVTINKLNGRITTHDASLASNTTAVFKVNNSTVGPNDHITITIGNNGGGVDGSWYNAWAVMDTRDGGFYLCLRNIHTAALAHNVPLSFNIVKGSIT